MEINKVSAVLFDLGDTIFNFGKFNKSQAIKTAARYSHEYLKELSQPVGHFYLYFLRNMIELRAKYFWAGIVAKDFDSLEIMKNIGRRYGLNLTQDQWEHLNWLWYKPLAELAWVEDDIIATLEKLRGMGLKLGIVSNTFVNGCSLDEHLMREDLLEYFPVRVYSCDFDFRKPDTRIFIEAAERISVPPKEILFVGDRLDTDVKGAIRSGMIPVLKNAHSNHKKKKPEGIFRVERLADLPALVEKICEK